MPRSPAATGSKPSVAPVVAIATRRTSISPGVNGLARQGAGLQCHVARGGACAGRLDRVVSGRWEPSCETREWAELRPLYLSGRPAAAMGSE